MVFKSAAAAESDFAQLSEEQLELVSGGLKAQWMDEVEPPTDDDR